MKYFIFFLFISSQAFATVSTNNSSIVLGRYKSIVTATSFAGSILRDFSEHELLIVLTQTAGNIEVDIEGDYTTSNVIDMNPGYYVHAEWLLSGAGAGSWWIGPKVSMNLDSIGTHQWYRGFVVEDSNIFPDEWDVTLTTGGSTYLGDTTLDGELYKVYREPLSDGIKYWSIRQSYRSGGLVSVQRHISFWQANSDLPNEDVDEIRLSLETSGANSLVARFDMFYMPLNYEDEPEPPFSPCMHHGQ